jgi:GTP-binding protein
LKLLSADFVTSAVGAPDRIPGPQIALAGRSNVGKSSLLNALLRRSLARTSAAPGKTRLVNVYRVTLQGGPEGPGRWSFHLIDLPGYGYARGATGELRAAAERYFAEAEPRATLLLVDARHPGLEADVAAAQWLEDQRIDRHIVATKIDKLTRGERARNLKTLEETFGTAALPVSAVSGEGLDDLWRLIARLAARK